MDAIRDSDDVVRTSLDSQHALETDENKFITVEDERQVETNHEVQCNGTDENVVEVGINNY